MPDTFDLDAAFRDLEQDVAHVTRSAGAAHAVRAARRRRRTTIGTAAALVLLVGGGVAVGQSALHQDTIPPSGHLPAPAPLDGPHLTTATAGWAGAWSPWQKPSNQSQVLLQLKGNCFIGIRGGSGTLATFMGSGQDSATTFMSDYGDHPVDAREGWRRLARQMSRCGTAAQVSSFDDGSGVAGRTYRITPKTGESAPEYVWMVTTGTQIGELWISGENEPLPTRMDRVVADALLAAIRDPASYVGGPSGTSAVPRVDAGELGRALGSWRTGWTRSGTGQSTVLASRCYPKAWLHESWARNDMGLGSNGRQDLALFHSTAAARAAAESLVDTLRACASARYVVTSSAADPDSMLAAVSGPMVVWVAQHQDTVGVVRLPSGGTAPPHQVTTDVGTLMFAAMDALAREGG